MVLGRRCGRPSVNATRSVWVNRLQLRSGPNVAAVALANKKARVMWALFTRNQTYRPSNSAAA
jgi:hypothetical protein